MNGSAIERVFRAAGGRIIAALAARFRDLSLAEDAFAEACARAVRAWQDEGVPKDPAAWLYQVAVRVALDQLRAQRTRLRITPDPPPPEPTAEDAMIDDRQIIPDERLRLIFICCHPAVAPDSRAALTLRLVCGLTTTEIARAFLIEETALAQRLVRAKRKIADAAVPFELPAPEHWDERLEAVMSTVEVAYSKAHEDAAGLGAHAGFAGEMLHLSTMLVSLLPDDGDAHALAALLHYAEARRPARVDTMARWCPCPRRIRRSGAVTSWRGRMACWPWPSGCLRTRRERFRRDCRPVGARAAIAASPRHGTASSRFMTCFSASATIRSCV